MSTGDIYIFLYITKQLPVIMHCLLAYHVMAVSQKLRYPKKNFSEGEKCHKNKKEDFILNNNRWHRERTRLWSQHEASFLAKYKTTPFFPYCSLVCLFKNSIVDIAQTGTFFSRQLSLHHYVTLFFFLILFNRTCDRWCKNRWQWTLPTFDGEGLS